tara:strand:- start:360 stop:842 length:483 start_codon:yes stop_codon:yes gene_type:complete
MIQTIRQGLNSSPATRSNSAYINTYDNYENKDWISNKPIITFTSQLTGNFVNFVPQTYDYSNKDRFVKLTYATRGLTGSPAAGIIQIGTTDMPYGLYTVEIRENNTDALPDDATVLTRHIVYTGLMNLSSQTTGSLKNPAVEYTEYTTNDSDTESVYITN